MYRRCLITSTNVLRQTLNSHCSSRKNNSCSFRCVSTNDRRYKQFFTCPPGILEKVSFPEFHNLTKDQKVVIIDVREPNELIKYGAIPRSINIPLLTVLVADIEAALKNMSNDQFLSKYGCKKPDEGTPLVFSCMTGKRSEKAQLVALQLGYKNVKNYSGGWTEWAEKTR